MTLEEEFHGPNLGYVLDIYDRYRNDPATVDQTTRKFFEGLKLDNLSRVDLQAVIGSINLAQAIRSHGYLAARLNPLGNSTTDDPLLTLEFHHLQEDDLLRLPANIVNFSGKDNVQQAIKALRSIYSKTIGYDYGHIRNPQERDWLKQSAESGQFRPPQQSFDENKILERLTQVEAFELFLHRLYPGKTRFSIEGVDMLVPMLDEIIASAALDKISAILMGMAHRGRLNVLAHVLHKPYDQILAEFRDPKGRATTWDELGWTGDVKYHMGGYRSLGEDKDTDLVIRMPANPSHLEHIDPVIQGMARAANTQVDIAGPPRYFDNASLPILIHGDASFPGQGVVSETLNFSRLPGYSTSGSLHIITNNQLGFTAIDSESRSSLHASDLAKGFEIPVIHVNADDPQACIEAARTAFAYRQKFHKDFVINLIGYRRYGHNEGDEPRFTQPAMYQKVDKHPTVRQLWASALEAKGQLAAGKAEALLQAELKNLQEVNDKLDEEGALREPVPEIPPRGAAQKVKTAVSLKRLKELNQALMQFPESFHLNPKLVKAVERRRKLLSESTDETVDWAAAEELAFASILEDGIPIRLTGEDTIRGTFSQRHAAFYDVETNQSYVPMHFIPQAQASFEVLNSPLSEAGAIGFEVGYNVQAPERLVVWEAQYGDFINVAQAMLDEFLLAGRAKWGFTPSLVLLLPHGNEGQGPDHSSGRIERFLNLAAETNVRIVYPSTAAQYFHLLRRQALLLKTDPLPLIVFTPKGLLRHPLVASPASLFVEGNWQAVMDDAGLPGKRKDVKDLILCSGRIYVDLVTSNLRKENKDDAIARVEQLYPFPKQELEELIGSYGALERVIWVQEEPSNMGAWNYLRPRLRELIGDKQSLHYVGRPESSSPAEGSTTLYRLNQQALIEQAFNIEKQTRIRSVINEEVKMTTKILVPELGESVLEATVSRWLKKEGEPVNVGEVVVELETDKVNLEVGAKSSGVLAKIEVHEGMDVKVGEVLGTIEDNGKQPEAATQKEAPQSENAEEKQPESARKDGRESERQSAPQLTPVASRLARENNVDVSRLSGTGIQGRVTRTDVEQFLQGDKKTKEAEEYPGGHLRQAPAESEAVVQSKSEVVSQPEKPSVVSPSKGAEERIRMSRRRRTIAQRLLDASQGTAMLTTFNEIDMSAVMDLRKRRNEEFQKRHGIKLGFMSFFAKATISALKAFPPLNAEIQGEEIVLKHYYDIGMAIGSEEGLVVPVIRGADHLSFAEIEKQIKEFVKKTEQGKLAIEDLRGGTFTITNGGVFGSLLSTPILNTPEVGILGLHKIEERPIAVNGQVVIRPMMYVALSYDHRIVDGREAVQFLVHIKQLLEDPAWMLVEG